MLIIRSQPNHLKPEIIWTVIVIVLTKNKLSSIGISLELGSYRQGVIKL